MTEIVDFDPNRLQFVSSTLSSRGISESRYLSTPDIKVTKSHVGRDTRVVTTDYDIEAGIGLLLLARATGVSGLAIVSQDPPGPRGSENLWRSFGIAIFDIRNSDHIEKFQKFLDKYLSK